MQMLATPLYAVGERRPELGVLKVLGFTDSGDPWVIPIGSLTKSRPVKPGVWDQVYSGRLSFFDTKEDAYAGRDRIKRWYQDRTNEFINGLETHLAEAAQ